jgi:ABC-type thiamin/hydroxymethylpyrimidine transport system permease subunit
MNLKLTKNLGWLLTGIWLLVTGLLAFVHIPISGLDTILAILAVAAGAMLLLGR